MNDIAIYYGRPTSFSKDNNNYYDHLYFLRGSDFINSKKTDIIKFDTLNLFHNVFNPAISIYNNQYQTLKTWQEFYDQIDVSFLKDYKLLYYFYPLVPDIINENKRYNFHFKDLNHRTFMKFISFGTELANAVILAKASEIYHIPLYQYNFEVGAADLRNLGLKPYNYRKFHGYTYKDNECLISLPYYYAHKNDDIFFAEDTQDKVYDFTFFGTYEEDECATKIKDVENLKQNYLGKFDKVNFRFIKRKTEKEQRVPLKSYINILQQSKYTYISPSYIKDVVAIDRFMEGLFNDCLPLFGDSVYLKDISDTFDFDFEQIRIKNYNFTEQNRIQFLENIKNVVLKQRNPKDIILEGIKHD